MFFDNQDIDVNFYFKKINNEQDTNPMLVDAKTGLERGNLFSKEYLPYKNFVPRKIVPKNDKEKMLLQISEDEFALHDLSLYLDLHPEDTYRYQIFKSYVTRYKDELASYEKIYGPLNVTSVTGDNYEYANNPWPWDNDGGISYV